MFLFFFIFYALAMDVTLQGAWTGASEKPAQITLQKNGAFVTASVSLATQDPPTVDSILIFNQKLPLEFRPTADRQVPGILVIVNGAFYNGILFVTADGDLAVGVSPGEHGPSAFGTTGECGVFSAQVSTYLIT